MELSKQQRTVKINQLLLLEERFAQLQSEKLRLMLNSEREALYNTTKQVRQSILDILEDLYF